MPLLSKEPDSFLHLSSAFVLLSVISYSLKVLSGSPGAPVYLISQWQVYFFTQELMARTAANDITRKKDGRSFMYAIYLRMKVVIQA